MNQLQIFILVLMVIFTILSFWTDLKNFWNTGNKFGEGMRNLEGLMDTVPGSKCSITEDKKIWCYPDVDDPISKSLSGSKMCGYDDNYQGEYYALDEKTAEEIFPGKPYTNGDCATNYVNPGNKIQSIGPSQYVNNPCWQPKQQWQRTGPGLGAIVRCTNKEEEYKKKEEEAQARIAAAKASTGGKKIQLAIDGAWNSDINKEFDCIPDKTYTVDESPAYSESGKDDKKCHARDKCQVQINEKCEARIGMWDRCVSKNIDAGGNPIAARLQSSTARSVGWSDWIGQNRRAAGKHGGCKIKQIVYKQTPEAAAMNAQAPSNETPVVNNIKPPGEPVWHDEKLAKAYKLPNGYLVRPSDDGTCPNGCKMPHYDNKDCANEIIDGKEYRNCPWVKDGTNDSDCKNCGAILMPKNEYGYARTNPSLFSKQNINVAIKHAPDVSFKGHNNDDNYNIGKSFMKQLAYIRHFDIPESIDTKEFSTIGKLVQIHQKYPNSNRAEQVLTNFINTILRTSRLSHNDKNITQNKLVSEDVNAEGGNFDVDKKKLTGIGARAYQQGLEEAGDDNRLGGAKTLYRKMTQDSGYTKHYNPRDPRRKPSPYNSIWNVFNY